MSPHHLDRGFERRKLPRSGASPAFRSIRTGWAGLFLNGLIGCFVACSVVVASSGIVASAVDDPPEGAVLWDSFARADNWQIGAATTGQPWALWSGTAVITGEQVAATTTGYTLAVADATVASGVVSMSVPTVSDEFWLILRASNTGNYWRFGRWQGGDYQLQQINSWALGSPNVTLANTVTATDGDEVECQMSSSIACSVNDVPVASSTDTFNTSATHFGFAMADAGAAPTTRIDDLSVIALAPAPDISATWSNGEPETTTATTWNGSVEISNPGTARADNIELALDAPTPLSAWWTDGTCTDTQPCALGSLEPGENITVNVTTTTPDTAGTITLHADATSDPADDNPNNNSAITDISVAAPDTGPPIIDDFNRVDAYTMGTALTGAAWEGWQGTTRVASNRAIVSEPGYGLAVVPVESSTGTVEVSVPSISTDFWLIVRATNTGNYWRFGVAGGGRYELQQIRGWRLGTPEIHTSADVTAAAGDRLSCQLGSGITCSVNGAVVASSQDRFNVDAAHVGFAAYGQSAPPPVRFDDMRFTVPAPAPDLVVDVESSASTVVGGELVSFDTTILNQGNLDANTTTFSMMSLDGLVLTGPQGCVADAGGLTCDVGTLAPGEAKAVTVTATAPLAPGHYSVTATAASAESDSDPSSNRGSDGVDVRILATVGEITTDGFDRPDSPTLGLTEQNRPWSMLGGRMGVVGGQAAATDPGQLPATAVIDPGFTFGTFEVTIAAGADRGFGVVFRGRDSANFYVLETDAAGRYQMLKVINGAIGGLQFNAIRSLVTAQDGDRIRLVVRPDDGWFIAVNGEHIIDGGDVDLLGEFRFGLRARSTDVRFDDLSIRQTLTTGITTVDDFDRADGEVLDLRQPTSGTEYRWLSTEGYWSHQDAAVGLASPGWGLAELETSSELADLEVTMLSPTVESWVVFRYERGAGYYLFGHAGSPDGGVTPGTYQLLWIGDDGDAAAPPGDLTIDVATVAGIDDLVTVQQFADGTIRASVNGAVVAETIDTVNHLGASVYGIAGLVGATFDDFVVRAQE